MTSRTVAAAADRADDDIAWPEALAARVERLPFPAVFFYLLLSGLGIAYTWAVAAAFGRPYTLVEFDAGVFGGYLLGARHYLTHAARVAARRFRPLMGVDDPGYARVVRQLTTTSARASWIATVIGAAMGAVVALVIPVAFPEVPSRLGLLHDQFIVEAVPTLMVAYALGVLLLVRTVRQLQIIQELHASAPDIDPLRSGSVTAFSGLTLRIALAIFIPIYGQLLGSLELAASAPLALIPIVIGNVGATLIFLVPLLGLHARLESSRSAQLDVIGKRLQSVVAELSERVERGELGEVAPLQQTIAGLSTARDVLLKAQTWPWRPGTFTTFLSVIGAPLVIYLLTRLLARVV